MRSKRIYALVLVAGLAAGAAGQSFAASAIEQITAYINHSFKLTVDGEQTELPEGYEMLVYQNRTYVPVRAIGEMVGAGIDWDEETKTVMITKPETQPEDNENDKVNNDDREYKKLPITIENKSYRLSATSYSEDVANGYKKITLKLTALNDTIVRLNQSKTSFIIDNKEYLFTKDTNPADRDQTWYTSYSEKDKVLEGYLVVPDISVEYHTLHMEVSVIEDSYQGQIENIESFDIYI